jgi:AcrR family transcriptional regulator
MRRTILREATRIVAEEGAAALSARRLANAAGASTKVIYSHFKGMPGVVDTLYAEGFANLAAKLEQARALAKPRHRVRAVANAYRTFAAQHPDLFDLMYGARIATLLPTREARMPARPSLDVLVSIFTATGAKPAAAEDRARALWIAIHGVVVLERTGWLDAAEAAKRLAEAIIPFE